MRQCFTNIWHYEFAVFAVCPLRIFLLLTVDTRLKQHVFCELTTQSLFPFLFNNYIGAICMSMNDGGGMMELALLFGLLMLVIFGVVCLYAVYELLKWLYGKCRKSEKLDERAPRPKTPN